MHDKHNHLDHLLDEPMLHLTHVEVEERPKLSGKDLEAMRRLIGEASAQYDVRHLTGESSRDPTHGENYLADQRAQYLIWRIEAAGWRFVR